MKPNQVLKGIRTQHEHEHAHASENLVGGKDYRNYVAQISGFWEGVDVTRRDFSSRFHGFRLRGPGMASPFFNTGGFLASEIEAEK